MTSPNTDNTVDTNTPAPDTADAPGHDEATAAAVDGTAAEQAQEDELYRNDSPQELISLVFFAVFLGLCGLCAVFFL